MNLFTDEQQHNVLRQIYCKTLHQRVSCCTNDLICITVQNSQPTVKFLPWQQFYYHCISVGTDFGIPSD